MTSILKKGKRKKVRNYLYDYFRLPYDHYGFENKESIEVIVKHTLEYCERTGIVGRSEKVNKYFRDKFMMEISGILYDLRQEFNTYRTKNNETKIVRNKWHLKGFECDVIDGRGQYYYPKSRQELNWIRTKDKSRVESAAAKFQLREHAREKYIDTFLTGKDKQKMITTDVEVA